MYFGIVYLLFWIILSANVKVETICIGIIISLLVRNLNKDLMCSNRRVNFKKSTGKWLSYTIILIKEIIVSNTSVAKIVLSPRIVISPQIVTINTKIKSGFLKTIFANSITLTPGTLTISMDRDKITVHCLKNEFVNGLIDSDFEKIILEVEEDIYE
ncbi:Na+/H+ antiporter subunit E [Clostridium sp. CM028]|uniref:Na+/H+ antiporter subunit E n=1 Tax=Clostridium sp. CM028 TaxID=2851575 RepID=UPI001C6E11A3|nr:Na+/H+ antiporter subunit E [Clostridium sp. CM028]MBW9147647.1 Na+/H+ antiporter subunit E [Clostridium sp. CM028]WLC61977.1 Na+/H+ antiporter subunit E [Clostridium sp. CM028]